MPAIYMGNLMAQDVATSAMVQLRPGLYELGQPVPDDAITGLVPLKPAISWGFWALGLGLLGLLVFGGAKKR